MNLQKELLFKLKELNPELGSMLSELTNPDELIAALKAARLKKELAAEAVGLVKEMKINRYQYNQLIAKAPYNWVAKLANFQPI